MNFTRHLDRLCAALAALAGLLPRAAAVWRPAPLRGALQPLRAWRRVARAGVLMLAVWRRLVGGNRPLRVAPRSARDRMRRCGHRRTTRLDAERARPNAH
jgi:hypothetical protein